MISKDEIENLLDNDPDSCESLNMLVKRCQLEKGSVIPFVGAGLSKAWGFPLWGEFLKTAAGNRPALLEKISARIKGFQFEEAASDLMDALGPMIFPEKLADAFGDSVVKDQAITGAVAQLTRFPVARVVTTNFDRVLETCFHQHDIQLRPFCGAKVEYGVEALQQSKPFLLKLHGDWEDHEGRVLTLQEYEAAYGNQAPECADFERPLPKLLSLLIQTRCLLFLGCSLKQDRTMRVLSHISTQFASRIRHFAIDERPWGKTPEETDIATAARKKELADLSIIPIWYPNGKRGVIENILQYLVERMEEVFPPVRKKFQDNIPDPGGRTIGREKEIDDVAGDLATGRMVTILGPGGCGKSRLAIEVARAVKGRFPEGVWFIPLADLFQKPGQENLLPSHIGKVIGVPELPTHPPNESLLNYFGAGTNLLVLDNCEHLIDACRELAVALLKGCPGLKILATSRAPLKAYPFEGLYKLDPLTVPSADQTSVEDVRTTSAVELFVARAKVPMRDFDIGPDNAAAVAALCQKLCGIPLAIEIAAALLSVKTVDEISQEIDAGVSGLLDESSEDNLRQWKSMRAAIGLSYNLLTPELQLFLRRLSVFRGGWSMAAAGGVCDPDASPAQCATFTRQLVESSLVVNKQIQKTMRFRFLEPIRQFVQQKLAASEFADIGRRHAEWFLRTAEEAAPKLLTGEQNATLDALQIELDNFRTCVQWAIDNQQPETGLRLMVALWRFNEIRAFYTEGLARAKQVLSIRGTDDFPALKCKLLAGAGMLAYRMGRYDDAERLFRECLRIAESHGDKVGVAEALGDLGLVAMMRGNFQEAQTLQTRCKALQIENEDARAVAVANYNLGFLALGMGNYTEAANLLNDSLKQFESKGNDREGAFALNSLARCCIISGDLEAANRHARKSLDIREKQADNKCRADTLRTMAWASLRAERYDDAINQLRKAIGLANGVDDSRGVSEALDLFAIAAASRAQNVRLVELAAAAQTIRGSLGYALPPVLIAERDGALAKAKGQLGEQEYSRVWDRGAALSKSDAIEEALESNLAGRAG